YSIRRVPETSDGPGSRLSVFAIILIQQTSRVLSDAGWLIYLGSIWTRPPTGNGMGGRRRQRSITRRRIHLRHSGRCVARNMIRLGDRIRFFHNRGVENSQQPAYKTKDGSKGNE